MKKITTLFKKNPANLARVINEVDPENSWAFGPDAIATRKFDGTACAIIGGLLYKRYDVKVNKGMYAPEFSIPCQDPDPFTGHWPHWVWVDPELPENKYHVEAFNKKTTPKDGTYELVGPKINGNNEKLSSHYLWKHGTVELKGFEMTFEGIKSFLADPLNDIEGIVFHHKTDGRMCKIRKSDFGIKR